MSPGSDTEATEWPTQGDNRYRFVASTAVGSRNLSGRNQHCGRFEEKYGGCVKQPTEGGRRSRAGESFPPTPGGAGG